MDKLELFLKSLSDHELALFIGYRYTEFLEDSRKKIKQEAKRRHLDKKTLLQLFETPLELFTLNDTCPRCGSDKLFTETNYDNIPKDRYGSKEVAIDTKRCQVCNYNPLKASPKNIFDRIRIILKRKQNERVINWNHWI